MGVRFLLIFVAQPTGHFWPVCDRQVRQPRLA